MMTFLGLSPIEPPTHRQAAVMALLLVIALVVLATLGRLLRPFAGRRGSDATSGACGHCGYSLRGLPSTTCPECGSDTAVVGVSRPSRSPSAGRWIACALWIALLLVFNSNFTWEIDAYFLRLLRATNTAWPGTPFRDAELFRQLLIAALMAVGVTAILFTSRKSRWR